VKKHLGPALAKAGYGKDKLNLMVYDDGSNQNPMIPYVIQVLTILMLLNISMVLPTTVTMLIMARQLMNCTRNTRTLS